LTRDGLEVAAFAREAEERTAELVARLRGKVHERRVVLAAGAGAIVHVVGEGVRAFTKEASFPLDVITSDGRAAVDAVIEGLAHVGVAVLGAPPEGLETSVLTEVDQVLAVPRDHRLARRRRVRLAD